MAFRTNSWDFVCAQYDQGFFLHMLYARHQVGGYLRDAHPSYHALHYGGIPKPWRGMLHDEPPHHVLLFLPSLSSRDDGDPSGRTSDTILNIMGRTYRYLASTTLLACHRPWLVRDPTKQDGYGACSQCGAYLWLLRRGIERDERFRMLDLTGLQRRGYGAEDTDSWRSPS